LDFAWRAPSEAKQKVFMFLARSSEFSRLAIFYLAWRGVFTLARQA
ncbi:hypothetical protein A2U01_0101949, partial [Trifolium medium]|nr:hypothetical protein [Trifolium medium]